MTMLGTTAKMLRGIRNNRFLTRILGYLPSTIFYGFAVYLGDMRYNFDRLGRRDVSLSIQGIFGSRVSPASLGQIVREHFRLKYCYSFDKWMLRTNERKLARLVEVRGAENLDASLKRGRGAVLASAHYGAVKICISLLGALGYSVTPVARASFTGKKFYRHARHANININDGAFASATQAAFHLRNNEFVLVLVDATVLPTQVPGSVTVPFLKGEILLRPGAAELAHLVGTDLLLVMIHRCSDYRHQIIEISAPLPKADQPADTFRNCVKMVEGEILRRPAHWNFWRTEALRKKGYSIPKG